jgi:hypothetical protein
MGVLQMLLKFIAQKGLAQLWEAKVSCRYCYEDEDGNGAARRCTNLTRWRIRCDRGVGEGAALCEAHLPDWAQRITSTRKSC